MTTNTLVTLCSFVILFGVAPLYVILVSAFSVDPRFRLIWLVTWVSAIWLPAFSAGWRAGTHLLATGYPWMVNAWWSRACALSSLLVCAVIGRISLKFMTRGDEHLLGSVPEYLTRLILGPYYKWQEDRRMRRQRLAKDVHKAGVPAATSEHNLYADLPVPPGEQSEPKLDRVDRLLVDDKPDTKFDAL